MLADMHSEHSVKLYQRENELEKLIATHDQEWKQKLRRIQAKYDSKLAELMEKVNSLSCQTRNLLPDELENNSNRSSNVIL